MSDDLKRFRATVRHEGENIFDPPWLEEFWAVRHEDAADRIEELEAKLALRTGEADAKALIIEELEAKLAKDDCVQEAQKLFNLYAYKVMVCGATVPRLQNLENAWLNLKTQSELAELKRGRQ